MSASELPVEEFDVVVIGGGSGGFSAAKWLHEYGARVAMFDYVEPSHRGTTWGLGGTCVNVGCIPKKMMHAASLQGEAIEHDIESFGWEMNREKKLNWETLVQNVQGHIRSVNFAYRVQARSLTKYFNAYASFVDQNTVEWVDRAGKRGLVRANQFLIAVGGRPRIPNIPGAELGVTSDDIFSLPTAPGKTLVVGASYVALECAGFLTGLGYDTTVLIRSIPLRGFDQEMAHKIVDYMENFCKTKFFHGANPTRIDQVDGERLQVTFDVNGVEHQDTFDTVLWAVGRAPSTKKLNVEALGIELDANGKIITDSEDRTSVPNIYAIGDCVKDKWELTPVAVQAGKLLAARLTGVSSDLMDYDIVPTTVFTPLEYGSIGLSEESAIHKFGADNIEVYHMQASPYEQVIVHEREEFPAFMKMIVVPAENERVVGFHYCGPAAGELTQGFAVAMKMGATKKDFDSTVGIHPTMAELFTTMSITKRSGVPLPKGGCPSCT